jgi:large subunit ribosomal protein L10e
MRHAFGKPLGCAARVNIGQIIYTLRCRNGLEDKAVEAFRRASYKFAGTQRIAVSNKWGFTPYTIEKYEELKSKDLIINRGSHIKIKNGHGPITADSVLRW